MTSIFFAIIRGVASGFSQEASDSVISEEYSEIGLVVK